MGRGLSGGVWGMSWEPYWETTSAWKSKENPNHVFNKIRKEALLEFNLI